MFEIAKLKTYLKDNLDQYCCGEFVNRLFQFIVKDFWVETEALGLNYGNRRYKTCFSAPTVQ